jgi:hypothetical protein
VAKIGRGGAERKNEGWRGRGETGELKAETGEKK